MPRKLIGLVGYAGAGKDAAAEGLVQIGWERVAFADPLRQMALAIDPYIPCHAGVSGRLSSYVEAMGWPKAKQHPEVRRLLQAIGTEAVREIIGPNTWVELARKKICDSTKSIVVTDVRFANEAAMIRGLGGVLVRVVRPGIGPINNHVSDSAVADVIVDATVDNDGPLDDLHAAIVRLSKWVANADLLSASDRATSVVRDY